MITLHQEKTHGGFTFRLGNHTGSVFSANNKNEFYAALDKFINDISLSQYPKTDIQATLSDQSKRFIDHKYQ